MCEFMFEKIMIYRIQIKNFKNEKKMIEPNENGSSVPNQKIKFVHLVILVMNLYIFSAKLECFKSSKNYTVLSTISFVFTSSFYPLQGCPAGDRSGVLFRFYTGSRLTFVSFCANPFSLPPSGVRIARSRRGEAIPPVGAFNGAGSGKLSHLTRPPQPASPCQDLRPEHHGFFEGMLFPESERPF